MGWYDALFASACAAWVLASAFNITHGYFRP